MPNNYLLVLYKHNSSGKLKCGVKSGGGGTNIPLPPPPPPPLPTPVYIYISTHTSYVTHAHNIHHVMVCACARNYKWRFKLLSVQSHNLDQFYYKLFH